MSAENRHKIVWWNIARFREVGAHKLPIWHGLVYLLISLSAWIPLAMVLSAPKLAPGEFGESLAAGFFITFYGFLFYAGDCLSKTYQLIKTNNFSRYAVIWLGSWSVMGLRTLAFIIMVPAFFIYAFFQEQYPYNREDLLLIWHCFLLFGVYVSCRRIRKTFLLDEPEDKEEMIESAGKGGENA